jgi:SAM-dependent methyltransferase
MSGAVTAADPATWGTEYACDNGSDQASLHHRSLASLLDPVSSARIGHLMPDLTGKRCLEVAYGGGSFALWLASRVGPDGTVLATDLKPLPLRPPGNLRAIAHNIVTDPVPEPGSWDLIHARLLLNHLHSRRDVLAKLAQALAPGGVLVTEDWQSATPDRLVAYAPTQTVRLTLQRFHAAQLAVLDAHGNDRDWATDAHQAMRDEGLVRVRTETSAESWNGGTDGARLMLATAGQVREEMLASGHITEQQLDELPDILQNPDVSIHGHRLYTTSGWRADE